MSWRADDGWWRAPFSDEQIAHLADWQANPQVHSYTCGRCPDRPLVPTRDGWVCRGCPYTQQWALDHSP